MQIFDTENLTAEDFNQILSILRAGGVIGFPTDTAYGLGADPFHAGAVERIFAIKGRPDTKPIPLLVNSILMAESVSNPTAPFYELAAQFWPGPLTVIVPAGTNTIGLRWPNASFATQLVERFGKPITATSANRSGMPT